MSARRASFPERVERGGAIAKECARVLFHVVAFALFAPIAWHSLVAGDGMGALFAIVCAFALPGILAPTPHHRH